MSSTLIDTIVLRDYLQGDERAEMALGRCAHRALSVVSWLDLMAQCPPHLQQPTRAFLRTFERLSISESIADEAWALMQRYEGLPMPRALVWASARLNRMPFLTADARHGLAGVEGVLVAYHGDRLGD